MKRLETIRGILGGVIDTDARDKLVVVVDTIKDLAELEMVFDYLLLRPCSMLIEHEVRGPQAYHGMFIWDGVTLVFQGKAWAPTDHEIQSTLEFVNYPIWAPKQAHPVDQKSVARVTSLKSWSGRLAFRVTEFYQGEGMSLTVPGSAWLPQGRFEVVMTDTDDIVDLCSALMPVVGWQQAAFEVGDGDIWATPEQARDFLGRVRDHALGSRGGLYG